MHWDREEAGARRKHQDRLLRAYLAHELYPYSTFYRARFDAAGVVPRAVERVADTLKVPPTSWNEVAAAPFDFILRPDEHTIARYGHRRLVVAVTWAKLRGGVAEVNRDVIDRAYKPIHWHLDGGVPFAYSADDLDRLAEAGRRVVALAGLSRYDALVDLSSPDPDLAYWQLVMGARAAGISALHVGPDPALALVLQAAPTVLSGHHGALLRTLEGLAATGDRLDDLHTLIAAGELVDDATRARLEDAGRSIGRRDLEVVVAWAPPGARALWSECRAGRTLHTYPDFEWLEVLDGPTDRSSMSGSGELAWTALAWHGTALFRLRTGVAVTLDDAACPACGRLMPRLSTGAAVAIPPLPATVPPAPVPVAAAPAVVMAPVTVAAPVAPEPVVAEPVTVAEPVAAEAVPVAAETVPVTPKVGLDDTVPEELRDELQVLIEHEGVDAWQAEYRIVDDEEELLVFLAPAVSGHPGALCRELDRALNATQYVILTPDEIGERVARDGLVLDRRA